MAVAALSLLGALGAVASLLALQSRASASPRNRALEAGRLLVPALPLMLVLFILFPRVQGPCGAPGDAFSASGLSDTMAPGDLARLGESAAIAFRVDSRANRRPRRTLLARPRAHPLRRPHLAPGPQPASDQPSYQPGRGYLPPTATPSPPEPLLTSRGCWPSTSCRHRRRAHLNDFRPRPRAGAAAAD